MPIRVRSLAPLALAPLLALGRGQAAGADPVPTLEGPLPACACEAGSPACLDAAWPAGGPLRERVAACAGRSGGDCAAEAVLAVAEADVPACLPADYAAWLVPAGGAPPRGVGLGLIEWSGGGLLIDLAFCLELPTHKLSTAQRRMCRKAGLIGDTEDGGFPDGTPAEPGPNGGVEGEGEAPPADTGALEPGGGDTGG